MDRQFEESEITITNLKVNHMTEHAQLGGRAWEGAVCGINAVWTEGGRSTMTTVHQNLRGSAAKT